jgi:CheY-like chemotaxis protein
MGHGGPVRVVVVDDYGPLHELLTQALRARGCDVVAEAANGREALDVVERMAADVLVMDLRMPVMDGLAATATMHDRFPEIEIVAFTSSDAPGVGRAMLCAGASRHFVKPDVGGLVGYVARR